MIKEVLDLLMEYRGMSTVFGGDLEADVGRRLAAKTGVPFFLESETTRLEVVMKLLFDLGLVTGLGGDAEGEVRVNCDRVVKIQDLLILWDEQDQMNMRIKP